MDYSKLDFKLDHIFVCIDDEEPTFEVKMWINKGQFYKCIPSKTEDTISGDDAFEWEDMDGNPIVPNQSIGCEHIKLKRFKHISSYPLS